MGHFGPSEEIEGGLSGQVRRLRGVILEGEEIKGGHFSFLTNVSDFLFVHDPLEQI